MVKTTGLRLERFSVAVVATALLAACGAKAPDDLLAAARQNLERGQGQVAIIELKNVLQAAPDSAPARFLLGKALLGAGDPAGAAIELERALEQGHPEEEVLPLLAQALLADKQATKLTLRLYGTRLPTAQPDADLRALVGEAMFAMKRLDEARAAATAALARVPEHRPGLRLQAKLLAAERKPKQAVEILERLVATDAKDALALRLLGDFTLQASGNREQALAAYRRSLEADTQSIETYESIVTLHLLKPDIEAARQVVAAAKAALPKQIRLRYFEAQLAFADGQYAAVAELLKPLLQQAPEDVNLMRLAGAAELKLGALQKAEQLLGDALARAPAVLELRRLLAETHLRSGQPAKALKVLEPSIDASSVDHDALGIAGQAAMMLGDSAGAVRYFERAARLRPQDPVVAASLALARAAKGDPKGGIEQLRRIAAADKGTAVDLALVSGLMQRRDYEAALRAIEALERKQPDSAAAPNLRGRILARQKDLVGARKNFELALKREPGMLAALLGLAEIDVAEGKAAVARERYASLVQQDPKNMPLRLAMADFLRRSGGTAGEVSKVLEAAVAADPTAERPRLELINLLLQRGDTAAALLAAQAGVAALPESASLLGMLGKAQINAGDLRTAVKSFTQLTQQRPDQAEPLLDLADVLMASGDLEGAERSVRRALEMSPQSVDALRTQANVALKQNRHGLALEAARKVQQAQPDTAVGLVMEGDVEMARGAFDAAAAAYRKATAKADAGASPARLHRALVRGKKESEAAQFADTWMRTHPADTAFVFYLGDNALVTGKLEAAEQRYRQVLVRAPEQAMALNNLAWVLVQQQKPGAVDAARRAVRQAPDNPAMRDTLALALASEKQYAEALQVQSQLLGAFPGRHEYRLTLARILVESGNLPRARQELDVLQGLGNGFAGQAEVRRLQERAKSG